VALIREEDWPELGEIVVATVERITKYGVYVMLDEYGKEGFLHLSEISTSWVKNIRDFVREGEKIATKVLRVDPGRKHIDLSLKRVTKRERREKILLWKRSKKTEGLMRSASQRLGLSLEEVHEKAGVPLQEAFGDIYEGLERAVREGPDALVKPGLSRELAEVLTEVAKEKIKISMVKVKGDLDIRCTKPDGVLRIKEALLKAGKAGAPRGTNVRIYLVSPPKYRIEVMASDYKEANAILREATKAAVDSIVKSGGEGAFERGK